MNNLFRGLLAGWGAKKLGGGCLSTILIFALIWWALGNCDNNNRQVKVREKNATTETVAICR